MPHKPLPFREVKRRLDVAGFFESTQGGSHIEFVKQTEQGLLTAIVPQHREIAIGTQRSIPRQARISPDEIDQL